MTISVHWCLSNNFGDALVAWMVQKLTGELPVWGRPDEVGFILGGSMLNHATPGVVCWGAGLASMRDQVDANADIRAVRGPISRMIAMASGAKVPPVYGDAAMILPRILPLKPVAKHDLGIVPHYVDQGRVWNWKRGTPGAKNVQLINVFGPIEETVRQILSCERILSSSLHGLVVAHAYGVPAIWMKIGDSIGGDGTKFRDHLLAVGIDPYDPIDVRLGWLTVDELMHAIDVNPSRALPKLFDSQPLWDAMPQELRR